MVYVLDKDGRPLMPTTRHGKVRRLLRDGLAVCARQTPFTIRLLYGTTGFTQDVTLGVDAGSKTIGLSATTKSKEPVNIMAAAIKNHLNDKSPAVTGITDADGADSESKTGTCSPTCDYASDETSMK